MSILDVFNPLNNTTPKFTEEQLEKALKWFDKHAHHVMTIDDGEPINVVSIEQFLRFLELRKFHKRSFHYPTFNEVMMKVEKLEANVSKMLTKEQFIYILDSFVLEPKLDHELKLAFQVFDTERRNFLEIDDMKSIVTDNADKFDEAEAREFVRDANICGTGNVSYEEFVDRLFTAAPELYELEVNYLYDNPDEDPSVPKDPKPVETVATPKKDVNNSDLKPDDQAIPTEDTQTEK